MKEREKEEKRIKEGGEGQKEEEMKQERKKGKTKRF